MNDSFPRSCEVRVRTAAAPPSHPVPAPFSHPVVRGIAARLLQGELQPLHLLSLCLNAQVGLLCNHLRFEQQRNASGERETRSSTSQGETNSDEKPIAEGHKCLVEISDMNGKDTVSSQMT